MHGEHLIYRKSNRSMCGTKKIKKYVYTNIFLDSNLQSFDSSKTIHTVDGNQKSGRSPVEVRSSNPIIYKIVYIPGGFLAGFLNHQQYYPPGNDHSVPYQPAL